MSSHEMYLAFNSFHSMDPLGTACIAIPSIQVRRPQKEGIVIPSIHVRRSHWAKHHLVNNSTTCGIICRL